MTSHLWLHWMLKPFRLPFATEEMIQKNLSTGRKRSIRHTGHYVWWRGADLDTSSSEISRSHRQGVRQQREGTDQQGDLCYVLFCTGWLVNRGVHPPLESMTNWFKMIRQTCTWTMINNYIHDSTNDKRGYMVCQIGHLFFHIFLKGYC